MSDYGTAQEHADAYLVPLRAHPTLTVYPDENGGAQTVPTGATPPYVAVHITVDRPDGGRLDRRSTRIRARAYTHAVGANDIAARAVADMVASVLLDMRPAIDGRACSPIRWESGQPPREDESTGQLVVTLSEVYRFDSLPG